MRTYNDRLLAREHVSVDAGRPAIRVATHLEVQPRVRKSCPMQCVGECGGGPCGNDCFCVSYDPQR